MMVKRVFIGLGKDSYNTAYNHKHAHCAAQRLAAYSFKAPRSPKRAYGNSAQAHQPQHKGVVCEKAFACTKDGVENVEHHREGLHRGHILHLSFMAPMQ